MKIVVGYDRTEHAQRALGIAIEYARPTGGTVHVVYVASQVDLDATGALALDDKRAALLSTLYPQLWKEVAARADDAEGVELDLQVRVAPVHLTLAQRRTAEELLKAFTDYDADLLVLGRQGRPGSAAEALLPHLELVAKTPCLLLKRGTRTPPPTDGNQ